MIQVAQIGVGYWGPNLLRNLVASPNFEVLTAADFSPERRQYVEAHYPRVRTTSDPEEILGDPRVQAVVIATPAHTHADLALRALGAGKHVLVEKPLATTVADVDRIAEVAVRSDLVAMVGHTFLYNSSVRYLRKMIANGDLGEIRYLYSQRLNLGRIRSDIDALWNLAPHDVSVAQYLLGDPDPVDVRSFGVDYLQPGVNDVSFMDIVYPNKVLAHIHVSWLDPHKVRKLTVVGSRKMVVYDDVAENKIAIFDKGIDCVENLEDRMDYDDPPFPTFKYRSGDIMLPKIAAVEPLRAEISHFAECIERGEPCLTGPVHARKVVQILAEPAAVPVF
ncbi:MAG: Gfo/Idh/MocA family oxidoreductase [Planctomycetes bacterium]|nr:Gfo/Idh/MocA family oxidoreductase [Planctomycetota bacterium]